MKYDYKSLYEKNALFLHTHSWLKKGVILFNQILPLLFLIAYGFLWVGGIFLTPKAFTPKDVAKIFFAPVLALFVVTVIRAGFHRPRPYSEEGANILPLQAKKSAGTSFPSRHLTCAAVITLTCLPYTLSLGVVLALMTVALGYCRFSLGWHYPSDLLAGTALGAAIGCLIFIL